MITFARAMLLIFTLYFGLKLIVVESEQVKPYTLRFGVSGCLLLISLTGYFA
jgi:hypothetical protein